MAGLDSACCAVKGHRRDDRMTFDNLIRDAGWKRAGLPHPEAPQVAWLSGGQKSRE